jgi:tetratricopeptide (TPR) repeat protein
MLSARDLLDDGIRYERSGSLKKAMRSYEAALAADDDPALVSEVLRRQADVHRTRCDWTHALEAARRSAEVARGADLPDLRAEALNAEAAVHLSHGHSQPANELFLEILEIARDERIRGIALQNLGLVAARSGDLETAETRFADARRCFQAAGYARGEAIVLNNYAAVALDRRDYALAETIGEDAIAAARSVDDLELVGLATLNFAEALAERQRYAEAEEHASSALGFFRATENRWRQLRSLLLLGKLSARRGSQDTALRVFEAGVRLAVEIGAEPEADELRARIAELQG